MSHWIWSNSEDINPVNRFTWFRTRVKLDTIPTDPLIRFAASSNGQLFVNGQASRRKMSRFSESNIRAEVCHVGSMLRVGWNVIAVLHHHWGPITTFQRSGASHAGLYVAAPWLERAVWKWHRAEEFLEHTHQIVGVGGDHRIRFPIVATPANREDGVHQRDFDGNAWSDAYVVATDTWPPRKGTIAPSTFSTEVVIPDVEIAGQREWPVLPAAILAAGTFTLAKDARTGPATREVIANAIAADIAKATLQPSATEQASASSMIDAKLVEVAGNVGEGRYITLDFHQPIHGYPLLVWDDATAHVTVDLGYGEISRRQYDGYEAVRIDGSVDPEAVVGTGYADRTVLTTAKGRFELPDERTARWCTLRIRFDTAGKIKLRLEMLASQYPVVNAGSFHASDARIQQAVALCDIHARVTMVDGYVDCPGREDGLWMEDARLRARIGASFYGDDALRRFQIRIYAERVWDDGNSHPFPPSNYPMDASGDWASQWIGMLYDQYMWSGDPTLARRYWSQVRAMVGLFLFRVNEQGVWFEPSITGEIRLPFNPGSDKESSGLITPWLIAMLDEACTLAGAINEAGDRAMWSSARVRVAKAFREVHVVPGDARAPSHVAAIYAPANPKRDRGLLQAAQALPTTMELLTREEAQAALRFCFNEANLKPAGSVYRWNNPTNFQRVLDALSHVGLQGIAWAHFIERFEQFLPGHPHNPTPVELQGPIGGPIPEYGITREDLGLKPGEINFAQPRDDTGSHGWYATPMVWLHERVLGVTIAEPGGAVLNIAPHADSFPLVSGTIATPKGSVQVELDEANGTLSIEIPSDVRAHILLPWDGSNVELKGPQRRRFTRA